ncbi:hypothetical protein [Vibrio coralliilyticus]|uniref:hypothetical protein n=1 Tax=Vibrio coralliilyticus TaxID=190893 RepID=UPI0015613BC4|nr:hypothetical protein [Vibrio coralliilyticus]NRF17536.1 hypothetical protein [Vibrio coralliilyticus]
MYRSILTVLIFVSFFCQGETKNDGTSVLNSLYVYDEPLGLPPYSDQWFIDGDLVNLNHVHIRRDGKSGNLSAPVSIDCKSKKFTVTGSGLIYTLDPIPSSEVTQQISKDVIEAVLQKVCSAKNT